jgi:hypothetical protein
MLAEKNDPRRKEQTNDEIQANEQAEMYLKSALEIEEREGVDDLEVAETLQQVG